MRFLSALAVIIACMKILEAHFASFNLTHTFRWRNKTISVNGRLAISVYNHVEETPLTTRYDKHYFCTMNSGKVPQMLLLNGSQYWNFPLQDTNLTLVYPSKQATIHKDCVITSFRVKLCQDSPESQGYVVSGGVMRHHIALNFLSSGITSFGYEFELYGLRPAQITNSMVDSIDCS